MATAVGAMGPWDWHGALGDRKPDHAVGDVRAILGRVSSRARAHLRKPITANRFGDSAEKLVGLWKTCSEANWDGYGARPLSRAALAEAILMLDLIPPMVMAPAIEVEPDGSVGFEWIAASGDRFAISCSGTRRVAYSGVFTDATGQRGTEILLEGLPAALLSFLRDRFASSEHAE